jgi:AP-3 complex subunit delta-1
LSGSTDATLNPSKSKAYRFTLAQRILAISSQDTYSNITDFHWYLSVLVDLTYVAGANVGVEIRDQLVDVVGRVRGVRRRAVELMVTLLSDESLVLNAREEGSCAEVLWAAAWICGEYCRYGLNSVLHLYADIPGLKASLLNHKSSFRTSSSLT